MMTILIAAFPVGVLMALYQFQAAGDRDNVAAPVVIDVINDSENQTLPRCHGTEYVQGSWEFDATKSLPSFPLCDANITIRDTANCGKVSSNASTRLDFRGDSTWPAQIFGHESECKEWGFLDRYTWNPAKCFLPAWNAHEFCDILGNKTVLIVGDSLARQSTTTLINNIMFLDKEHRTNETCQGQIHYRAGDTLVGRLYIRMNRGWNWKESVRAIRPDLVILSVGGHLPSTESFVEVVKEVRQDFEEEILSEFPNLRLIWRTIIPSGCQNEMIKSHPKDIPGYWNKYKEDGKPTSESFRLHYDWDQEAKILWSGNDRVEIIDMEPLALRSEAHPASNKKAPTPPGTIWDCTHMCVPGPLDLFSRVLLNTLRDMKEQSKW
eukprot:TRINITY_DN2585_c0_g2_i2.p1 TRINITY_DN2585_c0_g2~~TRINITY_DN2585_c0_g2_i2.p1  ORF type:complete len:380 (+),score=69.66 TRINITY_DN2585_c0_g2_i2:217-1356(+)